MFLLCYSLSGSCFNCNKAGSEVARSILFSGLWKFDCNKIMLSLERVRVWLQGFHWEDFGNGAKQPQSSAEMFRLLQVAFCKFVSKLTHQ